MKAINLICAIGLSMLSHYVFAQGLDIKSNAYVRASGTPYIGINNANLTINGTFTKDTERILMTGSTAAFIMGNGTNSLYSLHVSNTGGVTNRHNMINTDYVTIYSGSKLTIDTVSGMNVVVMARNKATTAALLIKSNMNAANGSFIFQNPQDSVVKATVEMYSKASKPSTNYKWQFFGIPVRTLAASPTFDGSYVRRMNEAGWYSGTGTDKHWIQLSAASTLTPFTGYEITQINPKTINYTGDLVNSNYASGKLTITPSAQYPGQHLIGNPYTAAINIKKIVFGTTNSSIIENTVYLYNTGSLAEWTSTGSGTTSGTNAGQHIAIPINNAGKLGLPAQIPSMQAFLVAAVSDNALATVSIPYSSVSDTVIVKNTDKQRTAQLSNAGTRIDISGTRYSDVAWIFINNQCTKAFDNGWDGYKFGSTSTASPLIYIKEATGDYQVSTTNDINETILGFYPGEDSHYTLTFNHNNMSQEYENLYLLDLVSNNLTDISLNGSTYSFNTTAGEPESRFKIITSTGSITKNDETTTSPIRIFANKNRVFVDNKSDETAQLALYTENGVMVFEKRISSGINHFDLNLTSGIYLATITSQQNQIKTKIVLSK